MRILIGILVFLSGLIIPQDLSQMREEYPKANSSEKITDHLFEELSKVQNSNDPVLLAYKGAVSTLKAKYAKGIKNKKEYFKAGVALLESSVKADPQNIEIRCLRLSVQENAPKIVGYKDNIDEDKQFILNNFKDIDSKEVRVFVKNYVLQSSVFEDSEKQLF